MTPADQFVQDMAVAAGSFLIAYNELMEQWAAAVLCVVGCWMVTMFIELAFCD